jgi:hypothetical protein
VETRIARALLGAQIEDGATIVVDADPQAEELLITWRNPEPEGDAAEREAVGAATT